MKQTADIDIDFKDRDAAVNALPGMVSASITVTDDGVVSKHNTGVYFTDIPTDTMHNAASIDYKEAAARGYFKLDFLNLGIYDHVRSEEHLNELLEKEPNWQRLWSDPEFAEKIIHVSSYYDLLQDMKPSSINEMAMFLAVIRPGKSHLRGKSWQEIEKSVWDLSNVVGYAFKHAHAVSYAVAVKVHMNIIEELEITAVS